MGAAAFGDMLRGQGVAMGSASAIACFGAGLLLAAMSACNSAPTPCSDANVQLIQASNYDQSCKVDSDCVNVAGGNACYHCAVVCPTGGAINRNSMARYQDDISKTIGFNETSNVTCHCPAEFFPCCRGGVCHADPECAGISPPSGIADAAVGRADGAAADAAE